MTSAGLAFRPVTTVDVQLQELRPQAPRQLGEFLLVPVRSWLDPQDQPIRAFHDSPSTCSTDTPTASANTCQRHGQRANDLPQ
jgi:hypothetical protein